MCEEPNYISQLATAKMRLHMTYTRKFL